MVGTPDNLVSPRRLGIFWRFTPSYKQKGIFISVHFNDNIITMPLGIFWLLLLLFSSYYDSRKFHIHMLLVLHFIFGFWVELYCRVRLGWYGLCILYIYIERRVHILHIYIYAFDINTWTVYLLSWTKFIYSVTTFSLCWFIVIQNTKYVHNRVKDSFRLSIYQSN